MNHLLFHVFTLPPAERKNTAYMSSSWGGDSVCAVEANLQETSAPRATSGSDHQLSALLGSIRGWILLPAPPPSPKSLMPEGSASTGEWGGRGFVITVFTFRRNHTTYDWTHWESFFMRLTWGNSLLIFSESKTEEEKCKDLGLLQRGFGFGTR